MIPTCKCAIKSQQRQMVLTDLLTTVLLLTRKKNLMAFPGNGQGCCTMGHEPQLILMKVRAPTGRACMPGVGSTQGLREQRTV